MWPLWLIITVAAGGAVSLTISAVVTVVYFERKRHRRLMARNGLDRNLSEIQRHHLSITDVDVAGIPRAARSWRHSYQRPRSDSPRFYATVSSQEEIRSFPDGSITDSVPNVAHIQSTGSGHQWLSPSKSIQQKRRKKIAKLYTSLTMARSPMSAITEATESSIKGSPEPIELPLQITPEVTPERSTVPTSTIPTSVKIVQPSRTSFESVLGMKNLIATPQGTSQERVIKSRSISVGGIAPPPNIPLPPIPDTAPFEHQRRASLSRSKSDTSLHKREVSALCQESSKHVRHAFSGFRFELTCEDIATNDSKKTSSKQNSQTFRFPTPKECAQEPEETLKTIDASKWDLPNSLRSSRPITPNMSPSHSEPGSRSVSMIDYDTIFSAGSSLNNSPTKPYEGPLSRPVSTLSVSNTDMFRLSMIGSRIPESPRTLGHRRQDCVRIKNLTPVDSKKRLSSQLGRLAETEEDDNSILLPSPARVSQSQNAPKEAPDADTALSGPVEATLTNDSFLSASAGKPPHAMSLRIRRPGWTSIKDKNKIVRPLPVPGDAAKQSPPLSSPVEDMDMKTRLVETGPTVLEAVKTSGINMSTSPVSPPNVFDILSPERRRTHIQGPRNAPPPSLRIHNQNMMGSPLCRKSSENDRIIEQYHSRVPTRSSNGQGLHKPISMLKNMDPPERASVSAGSSPGLPVARMPGPRQVGGSTIHVPKARRRSNTVAGYAGGHQSIRCRSSSPSGPKKTRIPPQIKPAYLAITTTPPSVGTKFAHSPSTISIWEDASVRGDSPEQQKPSREPARYSPVRSHRAHFDQLSNYSRHISAQQYQQLGQQPQIQRESLWKLQQNADAITNRALAMTISGSEDKTERFRRVGSSGTKRIANPRAKSHGLGINTSLGQTGQSGSTSPLTGISVQSPTQRNRDHIASLMGPSGLTGMEGIGLGLKFGERSMAYTINDMESTGISRLR